MKSFHNFNSFQSSSGLTISCDSHQHDLTSININESSPTSSTIPLKQPYNSSAPDVLNCNSGSRSLFMNNSNNNHNNFLRIPDALSAPSSPSIQVQSFNLSSSTPPSPILSNKNCTGYISNNNDGEISVRIAETDPMEKRFVLYRVEVTFNGQKWFVRRRYSEFHHLLGVLRKKYSKVNLKLPSKKIFVNNFSNELIRTRINGLNEFIRIIFSDDELIKSNEVRGFFNLVKKPDLIRLQSHGMDEGSGSDSEQAMDTNEPLIGTLEVELGSSEVDHIQASDFEFLKLIGKGSFGKVLLARHISEGQMYAVKVLSKKMILKRNEKSHIMCERAVLLKNLNHPFLVGLHYSFQSRDKLYFVLDYVNGGELFFHLQKEKCFTEDRARFYAAEITSALGYLHKSGIVYRDLKPENILLDAEGHIVLTDFGLCKDGLRNDRDTTNTFCGTPEYLAPEVLRKESYDRCVDWWCLGAVLYEMIYGLPPFYSRDTAEMYDQILHKPLRVKGNISLSARDILDRLLDKDKCRRLGHMNDSEEVKSHDFFASINWADLESKKLLPPFNPQVRDAYDLKNIDTEFTREPVPSSVAQSDPLVASSIPVNAFEGFSYADPKQNFTA